MLIFFAALSNAEWVAVYVVCAFFSLVFAFFLVRERDVRDEIHVRTIVLTFIIRTFFYLFWNVIRQCV